MCGALPNIDNGRIFYEMDGDENAPYDYRTRATYVCDKGFFLEGNYATRVCGDGNRTAGEWNGTEPLCQRKPTRCQTNFLYVCQQRTGSC